MTTCPFIWVDRDFALTRGWLQGFPKKLGSIWITRTFGLDSPADPGIKAGTAFGATCAAYERRVAEATVTLDRVSETGPTHNDPPIVNVRHFARLETGRHDEPAVHELARSRSRDRVLSPVWDSSATLELFGSRPTRSTTCWHRCGSARASASRSGTPSTTRRSSRGTCGDDPGRARHRRRNGHRRRGGTTTRRRRLRGSRNQRRRTGPIEEVAAKVGGLAYRRRYGRRGGCPLAR